MISVLYIKFGWSILSNRKQALYNEEQHNKHQNEAKKNITSTQPYFQHEKTKWKKESKTLAQRDYLWRRRRKEMRNWWDKQRRTYIASKIGWIWERWSKQLSEVTLICYKLIYFIIFINIICEGIVSSQNQLHVYICFCDGICEGIIWEGYIYILSQYPSLYLISLNLWRNLWQIFNDRFLCHRFPRNMKISERFGSLSNFLY
jgi:hypothetical protein